MKPVSSDHSKKIWIASALSAVLFFTGGILAGRMLFGPQKLAENSSLAKLQTVYDLLEERWYYADQSENLDEQLIENALVGMSTLPEDIHTTYFNLDQAQAFSQHLAGSNVGIGFSIFNNEGGWIQVQDVFINSAADKADIRSGDVILTVDGKDTSKESLDELIPYIQSREGKQVDLEIQRGDETINVQVVPGVYDQTVSVRNEDGIGILKLTSFSEESGKDVSDALARLKKQGVEQLVLDLRDNSGGYTNAALEIASSFLPDDTVVFQEKLKDGSIIEYATNAQFPQHTFDEIYILQNGYSASASEMLIGALKDHLPEESVVTIGSNTYGKGTEQTSVPFEDGTSLKYTMAEWLTPNGTSINLVGFAPDVPIEEEPWASASYYQMSEDIQIKPDSVHPNVGALQMYLQAMGYDIDRTDGYYSPVTVEAVKQWQSSHDMEADGVIDKEVFEGIINEMSTWIRIHADEQDAALNKAMELAKG